MPTFVSVSPDDRRLYVACNHGNSLQVLDAGSLALGNFQDFDTTVEVGEFGKTYEPVPLVRPGYRGTAWARGVADMANAIVEGRPHRASAEQAAHVVDILEAAAQSIAAGGGPIEITSSFAPPRLMPWADAGAEPRAR